MSGEIVGTSPRRVGGVERVSGAQDYVADIHRDDVLHVKLVTVDAPRARIVSIDTTKAEQVEGVAMVLTPDDLPKPMPRFGPQFQDRPILAVGETKYHGEPVAAVAAEKPEIAAQAAALVQVDHEVLDGGVFSVTDALDPDSPLVQDPSVRVGDPMADSNVLAEHRYGSGEIDESQADLVIDETYTFPMITQFAIEPHVFMAAPDNGGIEIWSSIQHPFLLQKTMASLLEIPLSKVRIHAPDPGGGFGGKQNPKYEPIVAYIALHTGRPARLVLSLGETFQTVRRTSAEIRLRTGLKRDGTLVFQEFQNDFLIGAYADIADRVVGKSSYLAAGPYRVPNVRIVSRSLLSHTTPSTAMRGFGTPQLGWARESNLDHAARQLGIDRVQIRLMNLAKRGEEFISNETRADGDWAQAVEKAASLIDWDSPTPKGRGKGFAIGLKSGPTSGLSYATVRLLADGSVVLYAGTSDMGQGARTIFAQIVSEELGVDFDQVTVVMGDTARVPYDQQTSASRSSVLMGNAISAACHEIQEKLRAMLARQHRVEMSEVAVSRGRVTFPGMDSTIGDQLPVALGSLGGEITGNGEMRVEGDPDHPLGGRAVFFELHCAACEVEVDPETGEIQVSKYVTVGDVGRALNPKQVGGQDQGAAVMGLGHTLMERMILDESGRILNMGAVDYRILTTMDVPTEMISDSVENADGPGPFGIKGVSEGGLLATAPAVGSAVSEATGVVIRDLPITPERIWNAKNEREKEQQDE
ncbi:MAG: molybdopterin-dependent oxidoreductase [Acidimicrobiia bacterium]|nr:molybdopterin-dependent oxidoreductase [Acidimicrobiia bacterium]